MHFNVIGCSIPNFSSISGKTFSGFSGSGVLLPFSTGIWSQCSLRAWDTRTIWFTYGDNVFKIFEKILKSFYNFLFFSKFSHDMYEYQAESEVITRLE